MSALDMLGSSWFVTVFCGCAIAAASGNQAQEPRSAASSDTLVRITGEFRKDGSCQVFADGKAVFTPGDSARTFYIHDGLPDLAPEGFDAHEVWCGLHGLGDLLTPIESRDRRFMVLLYAPSGRLAQTRTYDVRAEPPSAADAGHVLGAALLGMPPLPNRDSGPTRGGLNYLIGTRGTLTITRVDDEKIIGKFAFDSRADRTL